MYNVQCIIYNYSSIVTGMWVSPKVKTLTRKPRMPFIACMAERRVAPVVITSSTSNICLPRQSSGCCIMKISAIFACRSCIVFLVCEALLILRNKCVVSVGIFVTLDMPLQIISAWLYPRSANRFLCSGTGTIMSIPSKNPCAANSFAASCPKYSPICG